MQNWLVENYDHKMCDKKQNSGRKINKKKR